MENRKKRSNKQQSNGKSRKKVIIISIVFILLFIVSIAAGAFYFQFSKINTTKISKNAEDLGINKETQSKIEIKDPNSEVINIALFGLDKRDKSETGRSDSIMIATIDKKHKKIKLSSIMRDTYVNIPGHGKDKLTHAYAFGGAQLAIRTINENFELNIKDFATVDFYSLEKIINTLGGVTIDVKKEEINQINGYMSELANIEKIKFTPVTKSGPQSLNGMQAVAYTRIRYVGNGDYERTERQRRVLTALFNKVQSAGVSKYPSLVTALFPYIDTSMTSFDLVSLGTGVLTSGTKNLEQERFPVDGYGEGKTMGGVWYLVADLKATSEHIFKYLYDDIKPSAK